MATFGASSNNLNPNRSAEVIVKFILCNLGFVLFLL